MREQMARIGGLIGLECHLRDLLPFQYLNDSLTD